jgi:hypothetical protein
MKLCLSILLSIVFIQKNAVLLDSYPLKERQTEQRFVFNQDFKTDTTKRKNIFRLKKGSHFSLPHGLLSRRLTIKDTMIWQCRLDSSCRYIMRLKNGKLHEDQWDYNKLTGITFTPYYPQGNTAMVGWRYNPHTAVFELVAYWHLNYTRFYNDKAFVTVKVDEPFTIEVITHFKKNQVTIALKTPHGQLADTKSFLRVPRRASMIHPYFGGTSQAPKEMFVFCERIK